MQDHAHDWDVTGLEGDVPERICIICGTVQLLVPVASDCLLVRRSTCVARLLACFALARNSKTAAALLFALLVGFSLEPV